MKPAWAVALIAKWRRVAANDAFDDCAEDLEQAFEHDGDEVARTIAGYALRADVLREQLHRLEGARIWNAWTAIIALLITEQAMDDCEPTARTPYRERLARIKADFAGPGVRDEDILWLIQRVSPAKPPHRWHHKPGEHVYTLQPTPGCVVTVEPYGERLWRWSVVCGQSVEASGADVRIRHDAECIAEAAYTAIFWKAR